MAWRLLHGTDVNAMNFPIRLRRLFTVVVLLVPCVAFAHPGHDGGHGGDLVWDFSAGFLHPIGGLDHLLAMLAVGVLAARQSGRARWQIPVAFLAAMSVGALLGAGGFAFGGVEQAVAASVFALGLLIACSSGLPAALGLALTCVFAVFHGIAHGSEIPADTNGLGYGVGFLTATALLHASGLGLAALAKRAPLWIEKTAGIGVAIAGACLLVSA